MTGVQLPPSSLILFDLSVDNPYSKAAIVTVVSWFACRAQPQLTVSFAGITPGPLRQACVSLRELPVLYQYDYVMSKEL